MRERHLAGPGPDPAADEGRHRGRVVGRAKGPPVRQGAVLEHARHRLDHRDFEQFARPEHRQDRGQAGGEHRLAGPGRPVHQEVVGTRRRDLEDALGALLALDLAQVRHGSGGRRHGGLRAGHDLRALEVVGELDEGAGRQHVHVAPCPGRLRPRGRRADQAEPSRIRRHRGRQHPGYRGDAAVERQFAEHAVAPQRVRRQRPDRAHHGERDRQVVVRALLGQVGRGEIDGDALGREREARGDQRRPHPLARFRHRLVGQPHHHEGDGAGGDLHLHVDGAGLDPLEGDGGDARDHAGFVRSRFRKGRRKRGRSQPPSVHARGPGAVLSHKLQVYPQTTGMVYARRRQGEISQRPRWHCGGGGTLCRHSPAAREEAA